VLKISDFGVSEMFDKPNNMRTSKTAGSPAFLAPELCVTRHGDVDGKAADLWSMGVSLYCLRYGRIPFEAHVIVDMYDAIRNQEVTLPPDEDPEFVDLMHKILEKDPEKRITMEELRVSELFAIMPCSQHSVREVDRATRRSINGSSTTEKILY
jgi:[calcium/calmodulin-dependent protein kinase] kinase